MPLRFRRGQESDLNHENLYAGEPIYCTDTQKVKVGTGDGVLNIATEEYFDERISTLDGGSPKGVYASLAALQAAHPNGAEGIYIAADNGHWYYWNGSAWTSGGIYQATGLADKSVTTAKLADKSVTTAKLADYCVNASKISFGAVENYAIMAKAVTANKLGDDVVELFDKKADVYIRSTPAVTAHLIPDSMQRKLFALSVLGSTTQSGTPSPSSAVPFSGVSACVITLGDDDTSPTHTQTAMINPTNVEDEAFILHGIGDNKSYIRVQDGIVQIVDRFGVAEFDGSAEESVIFEGKPAWTSLTNHSTFTALIAEPAERTAPLCDQFPFAYNATNYEHFYIDETNRVRFFIADSRLASLDAAGAKAWLAANKPKVLYLRKTPIVRNITGTPAGQQLLELFTYNGKTHVSASGGSSVKLSYQANLTVALENMRNAIIALGGVIDV